MVEVVNDMPGIRQQGRRREFRGIVKRDLNPVEILGRLCHTALAEFFSNPESDNSE